MATIRPPAHLKKRRPRFKKKGKATGSFYVGGDQVKVDGHWVKVPILGSTISQGPETEWTSPKPLQQALRKLARYQRRLAKKVKGSNGYRTLKLRTARLHKRIADPRANTLDQLTSYLSSHFAEVVIEDLNVKGMMANGRLVRHIADVGAFEFRRQMSYKMDWRADSGRPVVPVKQAMLELRRSQTRSDAGGSGVSLPALRPPPMPRC